MKNKEIYPYQLANNYLESQIQKSKLHYKKLQVEKECLSVFSISPKINQNKYTDGKQEGKKEIYQQTSTQMDDLSKHRKKCSSSKLRIQDSFDLSKKRDSMKNQSNMIQKLDKSFSMEFNVKQNSKMPLNLSVNDIQTYLQNQQKNNKKIQFEHQNQRLKTSQEQNRKSLAKKIFIVTEANEHLQDLNEFKKDESFPTTSYQFTHQINNNQDLQQFSIQNNNENYQNRLIQNNTQLNDNTEYGSNKEYSKTQFSQIKFHLQLPRQVKFEVNNKMIKKKYNSKDLSEVSTNLQADIKKEEFFIKIFNSQNLCNKGSVENVLNPHSVNELLINNENNISFQNQTNQNNLSLIQFGNIDKENRNIESNQILDNNQIKQNQIKSQQFQNRRFDGIQGTKVQLSTKKRNSVKNISQVNQKKKRNISTPEYVGFKNIEGHKNEFSTPINNANMTDDELNSKVKSKSIQQLQSNMKYNEIVENLDQKIILKLKHSNSQISRGSSQIIKQKLVDFENFAKENDQINQQKLINQWTENVKTIGMNIKNNVIQNLQLRSYSNLNFNQEQNEASQDPNSMKLKNQSSYIQKQKILQIISQKQKMNKKIKSPNIKMQIQGKNIDTQLNKDIQVFTQKYEQSQDKKMQNKFFIQSIIQQVRSDPNFQNDSPAITNNNSENHYEEQEFNEQIDLLSNKNNRFNKQFQKYTDKIMKKKEMNQMTDLHFKLLSNYNKKIQNEIEDKIFRIPTSVQPAEDQNDLNFDKKIIQQVVEICEQKEQMQSDKKKMNIDINLIINNSQKNNQSFQTQTQNSVPPSPIQHQVEKLIHKSIINQEKYIQKIRKNSFQNSLKNIKKFFQKQSHSYHISTSSLNKIIENEICEQILQKKDNKILNDENQRPQISHQTLNQNLIIQQLKQQQRFQNVVKRNQNQSQSFQVSINVLAPLGEQIIQVADRQKTSQLIHQKLQKRNSYDQNNKVSMKENMVMAMNQAIIGEMIKNDENKQLNSQSSQVQNISLLNYSQLLLKQANQDFEINSGSHGFFKGRALKSANIINSKFVKQRNCNIIKSANQNQNHFSPSYMSFFVSDQFKNQINQRYQQNEQIQNNFIEKKNENSQISSNHSQESKNEQYQTKQLLNQISQIDTKSQNIFEQQNLDLLQEQFLKPDDKIIENIQNKQKSSSPRVLYSKRKNLIQDQNDQLINFENIIQDQNRNFNNSKSGKKQYDSLKSKIETSNEDQMNTQQLDQTEEQLNSQLNDLKNSYILKVNSQRSLKEQTRNLSLQKKKKSSKIQVDIIHQKKSTLGEISFNQYDHQKNIIFSQYNQRFQQNQQNNIVQIPSPSSETDLYEQLLPQNQRNFELSFYNKNIKSLSSLQARLQMKNSIQVSLNTKSSKNLFISRFNENQKQQVIQDQLKDIDGNKTLNIIENQQKEDILSPAISEMKKAFGNIITPLSTNILRSTSNRNSLIDLNNLLASPSSSISRFKHKNTDQNIFSLKSQKFIKYTDQGYMRLTKKERNVIVDQNNTNFQIQNQKKQKKFEKKKRKNYLNYLKGVVANGSILSHKSPQIFEYEVKQIENTPKIELNDEIYRRVMNLKNLVKNKYEKCSQIIDDLIIKENAQISMKNIMIDDQQQNMGQSYNDDINTVNLRSSKKNDSKTQLYQDMPHDSQMIRIVQNKYFQN